MDRKQHNEKKEYSAWSAAKISVNIADKNKKFNSDVDDQSHQYHQYDSGYGEDDSDDDDDDDEDDDDDRFDDNYEKLSHNKTSTPSWMFERAKNREDVRQQEQKSDWIFARANDRKKFHDLNAAEWHSRKSVNKICTKDNEGDESCENIDEINVASVNHGKTRSGKYYQPKSARGETDFGEKIDDFKTNQHFTDRHHDERYKMNDRKPRKKFHHNTLNHRNKFKHRKNQNYKTHDDTEWDDDDVILESSFSRKKVSSGENHDYDNSFKRHRKVKHHYHENLKSDNFMGTDLDLDTFFDDLEQGDQDYQQIFV